MNNISVDFSQGCGIIKPMNALNNGPSGAKVRKISNYELYEAAKIPYARLHDTAFANEWLVDVHRIFRDFDADENDPSNYVFGPTDAYLKAIESVGTKTYYRLGAAIEHSYRYGTIPPKDNLKWARICEHIIRHYTEGWANGYYMDIEYWEIWNEPDCTNSPTDYPCWQGTMPEFCEFFVTVFNYLKENFPHLKIGGPAIATVWHREFCDLFFSTLRDNGVKPDFISYHRYGKTVEDFCESVDKANEILEQYGFGDVETHYNEWNYVRGWQAEKFIHTIETIKGLKGSSFVAGVMCALQYKKLDMMMYYEGRPSAFCGLWDTHTYAPHKTYYTFLAFAELRDLGGAVKTECDEYLYSAAATNGEKSAVLLTYFNEADDAEKYKKTKLNLHNISLKTGEKIKAEVLLLDEEHNLEPVREEIFESSDVSLYLDMPIYTSYLVRLSKF